MLRRIFACGAYDRLPFAASRVTGYRIGSIFLRSIKVANMVFRWWSQHEMMQGQPLLVASDFFVVALVSEEDMFPVIVRLLFSPGSATCYHQ